MIDMENLLNLLDKRSVVNDKPGAKQLVVHKGASKRGRSELGRSSVVSSRVKASLFRTSSPTFSFCPRLPLLLPLVPSL